MLHQGSLPAAASAQDNKYLALIDIKSYPVQYNILPVSAYKIINLYNRLSFHKIVPSYSQYTCIIANMESMTTIRKIPLTTADVVALPTESAPPLTRKPLTQPTPAT